MPQHLRALVVITCLAIAVFWLARSFVCERSMTPEEYKNRCRLWFACVGIAFLSHNFWIFILLTGMLLLYFGKRDQNPLALYCMLLFAVPALALDVPGFGIVNFLFEIHYVRLLSLVILLPLALKLRSMRATRHASTRFPDICVALYLILDFIMQVVEDSFSNSLRMSFYAVMDLGLPYYVASRAISKIEEYREVIAALVIAIAVMGVIAAFETSRYWLLFNALGRALDLPPPDVRTYLTRGIGGLLRARATTLQPIVLGYVMMVAISLLVFVGYESRYKKTVWIIGASLGVGLLASLSRGPWVGTAAALLAAICLGPGRGKRIVWSIGIGGTCFVALLMSPYGARVIEYLPFVGSIESENVDYRVQLWNVSMEVLRLNPWLGDINYMENPILEQMRQGQGIIDMVNSYLQVALAQGIIGLLLFVGPLIYALKAARRLQRAAIANEDPQMERLGRALLATLVGITITIATVSSINVIPTLFWVVVGLCVGTNRAFYSEARNAQHHAYGGRYSNLYKVETKSAG